MSDIISQIFVLPVRIALILTLIILVMLWVVSIVWVNKDARQRGASAGMWTAIAVIPVAGLVAYCLLRPPLSSLDATEQNMSIELMSRELADYGNCPKCGSPVEKDYIACPHCATRLRNVCPECSMPLEPSWKVCPYCATPIEHQQARQRTRRQ